MPRLKNGRQKKKPRGKQKLVVAMVSKKSLRSSSRQNENKEFEQKSQGENESMMHLRPKRSKTQKQLAEEDFQKDKKQKSKQQAKKQQTKKGKKKTKVVKTTPKTKGKKRKAKVARSEPAKKSRLEEVEEMLTEFDGIESYEELKECEDISTLAAATNQRHRMSAKGAMQGQKRVRMERNVHDHTGQVVIESVSESIPKQDSEDDEDVPEEDDDDIDDSLFFGIPTEKSPDFGNCTHCKKKFRREELPDHIHNCPERYVQCRECNKVLSNLQTLERHHKRFHLKLREVPCTLCEKMFIDEAAARKHLKTVHFKVKNFHCPHCDKSFSQRNKLTYHVRTHSGEKPFACTDCGRSFSLLWNLKTHLRTHTGEKPYACDVCGRKFTQKQNMTSHMTTHKKPKLARSSSGSAAGNFPTFTATDNLNYFSMSELRQSAKASMMHGNQSTLKFSQSKGVGQGAQYIINQLGGMTTTSSNENATSVLAISQNNELENGLGLLSSVARKGEDNAQDTMSSNVEVECIVDQAHLSNQVAHGSAVDQVVEVLVQPQGGNGDATITISTTADGGASAREIESIAVKTETDPTADAYQQNKDTSNVATASVSTLQQQQQAIGAQNVIPIGNANLSGLANILQNPEVLAAINAAAASNKFIVIGPVGMLSGQNAGTTNTVSIATAFPNEINAQVSMDGNEATAGTLAPTDLLSNRQTQVSTHPATEQGPLMQINAVDHIDPSLATPASCDVEMIPADTSQDAAIHFTEVSNTESVTSNEVQSSVPNIVNFVIQGSQSVTASSSFVPDPNGSSTVHSYAMPNDQTGNVREGDEEVVSSQDGLVVCEDGVDATSSGAVCNDNNRQEVSSSAENDEMSNPSTGSELNQADSSRDKETGVQSSNAADQGSNTDGAIFNVNIASSYMNDDKLVSQSTDNASINANSLDPFSAAQQSSSINQVAVPAQSQDPGLSSADQNFSDKVTQSYIVSLGDQFVSSSTRMSLANSSFITSGGLSATGQSMVMVTADGQSYITTLNIPDGFHQPTGSNQQIILADSMAAANNFSIPVMPDGSISLDSLAQLQSVETSTNALFTTHFQSSDNEVGAQQQASGVAPGDNVTSGMDESAVTDSTPSIVANSSTSDQPNSSFQQFEADLENSVSGSNQSQQQVGNSLDDHVDSNTADTDQGFPVQASSAPDAYVAANSSATDFNAYQQALIDATDLVTGSSSSNYDGVVSGTENIVSENSLGSDPLESQRTGVTSSNLIENNAEAMNISSDASHAVLDADQGDSYVSTSLQV